jgi:hypothetical protein
LIGLSTNRLQNLYSSGELFEQYNSERKADITLLIVSLAALAAMGYFELSRTKRHQKKYRYSAVKIDDEKEVLPPASKVTSIYSAPETLDKWAGRRSRNSRESHRDGFEMTDLWMQVLRVYCSVLPIVYLYVLVTYLLTWLPMGIGNPMLTLLLITVFVLSFLTSVGVFRKRMWGIHFGYAIAIFHLLIFPIGTAAGLLMLVALSGVSSEFSSIARTQRREMRRKRNDTQVAVV